MWQRWPAVALKRLSCVAAHGARVQADEELPLTKLLSNPKVTLALSPTGGHLGYRDPGGGGSWVYKTIATHFAKSVCRSWLPLPARGSEAATVHARL